MVLVTAWLAEEERRNADGIGKCVVVDRGSSLSYCAWRVKWAHHLVIACCASFGWHSYLCVLFHERYIVFGASGTSEHTLVTPAIRYASTQSVAACRIQ